jgi:hypothetical protein
MVFKIDKSTAHISMVLFQDDDYLISLDFTVLGLKTSKQKVINCVGSILMWATLAVLKN